MTNGKTNLRGEILNDEINFALAPEFVLANKIVASKCVKLVFLRQQVLNPPSCRVIRVQIFRECDHPIQSRQLHSDVPNHKVENQRVFRWFD